MPLKTRAAQLEYLRHYAREYRLRKQRATTLTCECGQPATVLHCGEPSCARCKELTGEAVASLKALHNHENHL